MQNKKNSEIELLRALSINLDMLAHYNFFYPFILEGTTEIIQRANFGVGVDLFFCISGYVVSKAYINYFDSTNKSKEFWP